MVSAGRSAIGRRPHRRDRSSTATLPFVRGRAGWLSQGSHEAGDGRPLPVP